MADRHGRGGPDAAVFRQRASWRWRGDQRPPFATTPGPGQESVWDYPRPPRVESDERRVRVAVESVIIAESRRCQRVLETASPPTFYLPPDDVDRDALVPAERSSFCEWKGQADYWSVRIGSKLLEAVAWSYPDPFPEFSVLKGYIAFYPQRLACSVAGARVEPQRGDFYAGWVTPELVGPFKGEPDSEGW